MAQSVSTGSLFADSANRPRWRHGSAAGLQVWSAALDLAIFATLMVEVELRTGPIMLLNDALVGTAAEGAAISWALALLAECVPGFYVLRAAAG